MSKLYLSDRFICLMMSLLLMTTLSSISTGLEAAEISRQTMLSQPEKIPGWISSKKIGYDDIPNPHWKSKDCITCHRKTPRGESLFLRGKSIDSLCEYCHVGKFDHRYIHPSGIALGSLMHKITPESFADNLDQKGRITCATCHDIKAQCLSSRRSEERINPLFLRDGPYRLRSEICYKCHDISGYQRRNAH
ncbi:MAG: hypothetical protein PVG22_15345, partial [Chromatiales bacterium]